MELRASRNKSELITNFESGTELNETFVLNGSLIPLPPGEKATLTVIIPKDIFGDSTEPWSIYFSMKAKDEVGNTSCTFNIAETTFGKFELKSASSIFKETEATTVRKGETESIGKHEKNVETKTDDETQEHSNSAVSKWWPFIVGIGVAITIIIILALIIVIIIKKTRMKAYFSVQSEQC